MLPKFVIAGLAVTAFVVTTALIPTTASAGGRSGQATRDLELAVLC